MAELIDSVASHSRHQIPRSPVNSNVSCVVTIHICFFSESCTSLVNSCFKVDVTGGCVTGN